MPPWSLTEAPPKSSIPQPCATQAREPALLVSLLIGTNNLGHGHSPEATGQGVLAVARSLLSLTRGKLLINALLPRGDRSMCICMCMPHVCAWAAAALRAQHSQSALARNQEPG